MIAFWCILITTLSLYHHTITTELMLTKEVIIWDNDGTIMGSKDPHDTTSTAKVILPNVEHVMKQSGAVHIICSGCKTPESELQNFDSDLAIKKLTTLMTHLPIAAATFSPAIGGTQCYVILKIIKEDGDVSFIVRKAHEEARYQHLIGLFKKPGTGMLTVIQDIAQEELGITISTHNTVLIGDTWHDEHVAMAMHIPFLHATTVHTMQTPN